MKTFYIIFSIALGSLFIGCDDDLDLANPNSITSDVYWADADQAQAGINAAYNSLLIDGYYMRMTPILTDGRADDLTADTPWVDLQQISNFTALPTSAPIQWMWDAYYQQVLRVNQVIENVPDIEMDEDLKERVLGQAYFLRGLAYFNLKINFDRVPLVITVPDNTEEYNAPTATSEAIWTQIIDDFTAAQEMLPVSYNDVSGPDAGTVGRATKGAATGFLGKTYLYTENWSAAAAEFQKIIEGPINIYSLVSDYQDNFGPFNENNSESLFEVQFASADEVGGTVYNYGGEPSASWKQVSSVGHTYAMDGYGYSDFLPSHFVYNTYNEERTVNDSIDSRLLVTIASYEPEANSVGVYTNPEWPHALDALYPRKYTHDGFGFSTESQGSVELSEINYRLMRYADVLLMYAEALNELGQTSQAYDYIQQVRDRANLPDLSEIMPGMSQEEMRDQLAHERLLEFSLEGIRFHDIRRWGWLSDPEKLERLRANDPEFISFSPGREYLPIPQRDLDINPNLEPNSAN
ncbi:RagB/SusD family nutrient uptake outer membrane protein [Flavimarina sp. Hel_I_48]|uniref:RagB/SusD family nutrient uptake outer membrane protein n=1 Tax=Flavimarina sp. Hel_I_48 TaxID=1392488 RepID=UPI0004DF3779|nr:RagB/SusD family nutrient uptake outer membrane protein [Flavimarina sp. Hel_I_48]